MINPNHSNFKASLTKIHSPTVINVTQGFQAHLTGCNTLFVFQVMASAYCISPDETINLDKISKVSLALGSSSDKTLQMFEIKTLVR